MRASTAFFAGIGTVFVAIAAGLGGGLTIAHVMSPQTLQYGKADRHASSDVPSTRDPLAPAPYLEATKASANAAVVVSPSEKKPPSNQPQQSEPAKISGTTSAPAPELANVSASNGSAAKASIAAAEPVDSHEQAAPDAASAKVRDVDLKRDADQKRAERRRAERRQQRWADRRRVQPGRDQDDFRGVEQAAREDSEARAYPVFREQPARAELPLKLFGDD